MTKAINIPMKVGIPTIKKVVLKNFDVQTDGLRVPSGLIRPVQLILPQYKKEIIIPITNPMIDP